MLSCGPCGRKEETGGEFYLLLQRARSVSSRGVGVILPFEPFELETITAAQIVASILATAEALGEEGPGPEVQQIQRTTRITKELGDGVVQVEDPGESGDLGRGSRVGSLLLGLLGEVHILAALRDEGLGGLAGTRRGAFLAADEEFGHEGGRGLSALEPRDSQTQT